MTDGRTDEQNIDLLTQTRQRPGQVKIAHIIRTIMSSEVTINTCLLCTAHSYSCKELCSMHINLILNRNKGESFEGTGWEDSVTAKTTETIALFHLDTQTQA